MITYDGVPLCGDTPEVEEKILRHFGGWPQFWAAHPSPTSQAFAWMNRRNVPCPRPGTLVWPNGASRWAVGCYLARTETVEQFDLAECLSEGKTLRLSSAEGEDNDISFQNMRLLPPVPVTRYDGKSVYVLVFVDRRYFWRFEDSSDSCGSVRLSSTTYETTAWDDVVSSIEESLGITIQKDPTESVYLEADPETLGRSCSDHPLDFVRTPAEILDSVALNTGREVVYSFDDDVFLDAVDNTDVFDANMEKDFHRMLGYDADSANPESTLGLIPQSIKCVFRKVDRASGERWGTFYESESETGGTAPTVKAIACSAVALCESADAAPTNNSDLDQLSATLASDWYERFRWSFDILYDGICRFDACSQIDEITFTYSGVSGASTRIRSRPWGMEVSSFNHQVADAPYPGRLHRAVLSESLLVASNAVAYFEANPDVTFHVWDAGYLTTTLPAGTKIWVDREADRNYVIAAKCP